MPYLEQVSRAAYEKFNENLMGDLEPTWEACDPSFRARLVESIRAAVDALRPAHILTGVSEYAWNAAIDAILNEKPE